MKYFITFMIIRTVVGQDGAPFQQVTYQNTTLGKHPMLWLADLAEAAYKANESITILFWDEVDDKIVEECNQKMKEVNERIAKTKQKGTKKKKSKKSNKIKQKMDMIPMSGKNRTE